MSGLSAFSDALVAARRGGVAFTPAARLPETIAEAYEVQAAVAAAFGPIGAFKTALRGTAPAICAPIRADRCYPSGVEIAMPAIGVELEVGWLVTGPLPPGDRDALAANVRPLPVIELLERRIAGPIAEDPMVKLADGLLNWGLVIGTPLANWDGSDFTRLTGSMRAGGAALLDGATGVPGGSALATLEAFLAAVGGHCGGIRAGQILITGTLHPLTWLEADADVRGEIDGLGSVGFDLRRR